MRDDGWKPEHPVADVIKELLRVVMPLLPAGHKVLMIVEAPDGILTCGGSVQVGPGDPGCEALKMACATVAAIAQVPPEMVRRMAVGPGPARD